MTKFIHVKLYLHSAFIKEATGKLRELFERPS